MNCAINDSSNTMIKGPRYVFFVRSIASKIGVMFESTNHLTVFDIFSKTMHHFYHDIIHVQYSCVMMNI